MEAKVVCLANFTQELIIKANPIQKPKVKINYAQKLTAKTIEVMNAVARTPQVFPIANMLLLSSLPTRRTKGTEPLVGYSKFHVTPNQYLGILHKRIM